MGGTSSTWTRGPSSGTGAGPYTFTVTRGAPNSDGSLTIQIAAGAINDAAGNASTASSILSYAIDTVAPPVTNVTSTTADGTYTVGAIIDVQVDFNENVFVDTTGGTPTILLETGVIDRTATYLSGSGTSSLHFTYTCNPAIRVPTLTTRPPTRSP